MKKMKKKKKTEEWKKWEKKEKKEKREKKGKNGKKTLNKNVIHKMGKKCVSISMPTPKAHKSTTISILILVLIN